MASFIEAFLAELLCKIVIWLIGWIATKAGADDLIFMLTERLREHSNDLFRSQAHSLGAALVDRGQWLWSLVRDFEIAPDAVEPHEISGFFIYFGGVMVLGYLDFRFVGHAVDVLILKSWLPLWIGRAAAITCFVLGATAFAAIARSIMGRASRRLIFAEDELLAWLRCVGISSVWVLAAGTCAALLVHTDGRAGVREIVALLIGAAVIAYLSSLISELTHDKKRERLVSRWGKYGRIFDRRDTKVTKESLARLRRLRKAGLV